MRGTARGAAAIAEDIISAPERTRALPSRRLARTCGPLRGHTEENTSQNTFGTARTRQVLFCGGARAVAPPGRLVGCCVVGEARAPPLLPRAPASRAPRAALARPRTFGRLPGSSAARRALRAATSAPPRREHIAAWHVSAWGLGVPFFWCFFSTATCAAVRAAACFRGRSFEGGAQARVG